MKPEEVNRYLAENLMGWRLSGTGWWISGGKGRNQIPEMEQHKWDPYHSIAQALGDGGPGTVVGRMKDNPQQFLLGLVYKGTGDYDLNDEPIIMWCATFRGCRDPWEDGYAEADTPAAALTLAAVEALKSA